LISTFVPSLRLGKAAWLLQGQRFHVVNPTHGGHQLHARPRDCLDEICGTHGKGTEAQKNCRGKDLNYNTSVSIQITSLMLHPPV
jgi:hypothetical protein